MGMGFFHEHYSRPPRVNPSYTSGPCLKCQSTDTYFSLSGIGCLGCGHITNDLEDVIERSKRILTIAVEDFKSVEQVTWNRAIAFLRSLNSVALNDLKVVPRIPKIGPCSDGSIDLHWNFADVELLINFPEDSIMASFYGVSTSGTLKGEMDPTGGTFGPILLGLLHPYKVRVYG